MSEPFPIVQIQIQRTAGDCAICALSMYLGVPYEDVLEAVVTVANRRRAHKSGLYTKDMKGAAKRLGVTLKLHRAVDLENDCGVLALGNNDQQHAVLLKAGLIFDGDGTVWEPETYLAHHNFGILSLLVKE